MTGFDFSDVLDIPTDLLPTSEAQARELALVEMRPAEPARLAPIAIQPIELASEGLIALWRTAARSDIGTILVPKAIRVLGVIMEDAHAAPSARVAAAKAVLSIGLANDDTGSTRKALHEMSSSEIAAAIAAIRAEVVERGAQNPAARSYEAVKGEMLPKAGTTLIDLPQNAYYEAVD